MIELRAQGDAILRLLGVKHRRDVFVPECKDGPSQGAAHLRMDAWAMARSWTKPLVWAYEIKVSRGDFLGDNKWHNYLDYCNEFYFACPYGMIAPSELPSEVGLMWLAKTGTRLWTKKKAARRAVEIPEMLWRYLLMARAQITREHEQLPSREYWRRWLAEKREDRYLGRAVRGELGEMLRDQRKENKRLKSEVEQFGAIRKAMTDMGFDGAPDTWSLKRRVEKLQAAVPPDLVRAVQRAREAVGDVEREVGKLRTEQDTGAGT